ncbi:histidine kinase [Pseudoalteromonas sp. R3]|uniref:sensor histidine kinase n=1 Tax=Pseudoalteromonas sp. R3 TaxID=1709477 RepID=UPI0006B5285A|nr:histidine kinase [Pseudoalteromonas sp. R3]AZZ97632.1 sensor histidine kinase [Pseudoalteromonas sp. R3]
MDKSEAIGLGLLKAMVSERGVLAMLIASQSLSFIYTLADYDDFWLTLGLVSLFTHGNALLSLGVIALISAFKVSKPAQNGVLELSIVFIVFISVCIGLSIGIQFTPLSSHVPIDWGPVFSNSAICCFVVVILLYFMSIYIDNVNALELAARAEIDALQARIRPHFLHNTLNTLAELTHENAADAEQAALLLARLMRVSFAEKKWHTIADEVALTKDYLCLERFRFEQRLQVQWLIDDALLSVPIPTLTLQPLVENAVLHGIEKRVQGGTITIHIEKRDNTITLSVTNPLPHVTHHSSGNGIATKNIDKRLSLYYQRRASLRIERDNDKFLATITLPDTGAYELSDFG